MGEADQIVGLPADHALSRLLFLMGVGLSLQTNRFRLSNGFGVEEMLLVLRNHGFDARPVQISGEELRYLKLPTLAQLEDGSWILLRDRRSRSYKVEQSGGSVVTVPLTHLKSALNGHAIDLDGEVLGEGSLWVRVLRIIPRYRRELLLTASYALLLLSLALVVPWLTGKALDQALPMGAASLLKILSIGLLFSVLFRVLLGWLREITLFGLATRFESTMSKGLLDHILWLPYRYLEQRTLGELLQAFSGLALVRVLLLNNGLGSILGALTAVVFLAWMIYLYPILSIVILILSILMIKFQISLGRIQGSIQKLEVEASQDQRSALAEMLNGLGTLKATGRQNWAMNRWSNRLRLTLNYRLQRERWALGGEISQELFRQLLSALVLIWGGNQVLAGNRSLGELVTFTQLSSGFVISVVNLTQSWINFITLKPQLAMTEKLLEVPRQSRPSHAEPIEPTGAIIVEDVWFRYAPECPWVLRASCLRVEQGALFHLQGQSGSGKSTLLKLIAGLYDPNRGRISVGGFLPRIAATSMSYLPQFPQLLSGSILDNLKIFSGGASQPRIVEVAKETGLSDWVSSLPMGYQTIIVSGGGNISGGQRQLIAITALLASDKKILLLDEALSNLDWVSRSRIIRSRHFKERTVLYASHEEILTK